MRKRKTSRLGDELRADYPEAVELARLGTELDVTVAERPPRAEDFPGAPPENLVAGSIVFTPPPEPVRDLCGTGRTALRRTEDRTTKRMPRWTAPLNFFPAGL